MPLGEELARPEEILDAVHFERHVMERQVPVLWRDRRVLGAGHEPERVVIGAVA
jgi:hypothetical protein